MVSTVLEFHRHEAPEDSMQNQINRIVEFTPRRELEVRIPKIWSRHVSHSLNGSLWSFESISSIPRSKFLDNSKNVRDKKRNRSTWTCLTNVRRWRIVRSCIRSWKGRQGNLTSLSATRSKNTKYMPNQFSLSRKIYSPVVPAFSRPS